MSLIHILKGYLLDKGSTMKLKGEDIVELGLTIRFDSCPIFPFEFFNIFLLRHVSYKNHFFLM